VRLLATALVLGLVSAVPAILVAPAHAQAPADAAVVGALDAGIHSASVALDALASLPPEGIGGFLDHGGSALVATLSTPQAIPKVATWWDALPTDERGRLERNASPLVGNLDGVPFSVRSAVNEARLRARTAALERIAARAFGPAALAAASDLSTLRAISQALRRSADEPGRSLITFQTSGSMLAAIAIGDIDTATDVSILVPGMLYGVQGQLVDWAGVAADLYSAQTAALERLGATDRSVATIAWLGYRTPDLLSALSLDPARQGADRLESVLSGLRAVRAGDQPYLSVIAHSYGSTTALLALQRGTVSVDALAILGSPGGEVTNVRALDVSGGNVYVGAAEFDPVAISGYFGSNPDAPAFGAHRMPLSGGIDPLDGDRMLPTVGHNGYFSPGTESMRNLALIGIGHGSLAVAGNAASSGSVE
jgi:Alpha/beta hydrolase of unknown function (DUF1023).